MPGAVSYILRAGSTSICIKHMRIKDKDPFHGKVSLFNFLLGVGCKTAHFLHVQGFLKTFVNLPSNH